MRVKPLARGINGGAPKGEGPFMPLGLMAEATKEGRALYQKI